MSAKGKKILMATAALFASSVLYAAPAAAQATRTWISGVGDDVNPCSRTAPCKTFAGAISKTAAGGEINCLDPGGFGGVTITKAISLICDDTEGGILVSGSPGITVNAGDTDVVTISGMDMFGPTTAPGTNGVNFVNGGALHIRNTTIKGFSQQGINFGVQSGKTALLTLENVTITGTGTAGDFSTGGVKIAPASNATANVVIHNTRIAQVENVGIRADLSTLTGATINASVSDTVIARAGVGMLHKAPPGTGVVNMMITNVASTNNATSGITVNGLPTTMFVRVARSVFTQNGTGLLVLGTPMVLSYGNNQVDGNTTDGAFTGAVAPK